jgi:hypothetical protein
MGKSRQTCDLELLRQIDNDLLVQYEELLCLRAELAGLLFPLRKSPPRKQRNMRSASYAHLAPTRYDLRYTTPKSG